MFWDVFLPYLEENVIDYAVTELTENAVIYVKIERLKRNIKDCFSKNAGQIEAILDELDLQRDLDEQRNDFINQLREKLGQLFEKYELDPDIHGRLIEYTIDEVYSILVKKHKDWAGRINLQQQVDQLRNDQEGLHDDVVQLRRDMSKVNQPQEIILPGNTSIDPGVESFRVNDWSGRKQDLEKLYQLFFEDNRGLVFLHGQPGMGKTVLAKLFFEYLKEKQPEDEEHGSWQVYMISGQGKLSQCIPSLAGERNSGKYNADQILDVLKGTTYSRTLLIIDNYEGEKYNTSDDDINTESRLLERLQNDCQAKVLITTRTEHRNQLIGIYALGAVSDPSQLFYSRVGNDFINKLERKEIKEQEKFNEEIQELVNLIYGNTLLIVLCAHLLEESDTTVEEMIEALGSRAVGDITTEVPIEVDRLPLIQDEETVYNQVRAILDLSSIMDDENERKVMANAAILPLQGMEFKTFLKMTTCDEGTAKKLMKRAWLIDVDNKRRIAMHPMISEVVQRWQEGHRNTIVDYEACKEYCESVCEELSLKKDAAFRFPWRIYADEIDRVFSNEKNDILLHLWYRMSDIYDKRGEWNVSADLVGRVLDGMAQENIPNEKSLDCSRMYAGCGYSMVNYAKPAEDKPIMENLYMQRGFAALKKAEELLKDFPNQGLVECQQVYALLLSNWGAYYQKLARNQKDDEKKASLDSALQFHNRALEKRQALVDHADVAVDDVRNYKKELANSLTTVGTDLFYMEDYRGSAEYHRKALQIRQEVDDQENIYVSEQRIIGNIIRLLKQNMEEQVEPKSINPEDRTQLEEALGFYPELIIENISLEKVNALKSDLDNLRELYIITQNLPENAGLMELAENKKSAVQNIIKENQIMEDVLGECKKEHVADFFRC